MAEKETKKPSKEQEKAYQDYIKEFTPKPKYVSNSVKAFLVGGLVCTAAYYVQTLLEDGGMKEKDAGALVTVMLVMLAQLLTGLGWFHGIARFAGAGVIVPITGFANAMVAPAIEYKKEGLVLGIGAKLFTIAGPVLVLGIFASAVIGAIYWIFTG